MSAKVIKLEDAHKWFDRFAAEHAKAAKRGLLSAAARAVAEIKTQIIPGLIPEPVNRGTYKAGWDFGEDDDGAWYGNDLPHAPLIEYGVRAGNVKIGRKMIDGLTEWVEMKGMGKGPVARKVAWMIASSQKMRGVFNNGKGYRVMEKMNKRLPKIIKAEVERELKRAAGRA